MDRIQLDSNGTYTVPEVTEFVKIALEYVGRESKSNPLRYSASDVYWILHDLLRYVNARTEGEFVLTRLKKGTWRLDYQTEDAASKKSEGTSRAGTSGYSGLYRRFERAPSTLGLMPLVESSFPFCATSTVPTHQIHFLPVLGSAPPTSKSSLKSDCH
jgi:hypothetical protein